MLSRAWFLEVLELSAMLLSIILNLRVIRFGRRPETLTGDPKRRSKLSGTKNLTGQN